MTVYQILIRCICLWQVHLFSSEFILDPKPVATVHNPCPHYSLINSVDYHPKKNLFCVTYTNGNRVVLYQNDHVGIPEIVQTMSNPKSHLHEPQHAIFSQDGKKIFVVNWTNLTLTVYRANTYGIYCQSPVAAILAPESLMACRPHGMAISPCGNYLAIAYGFVRKSPRAVALFHLSAKANSCVLVSLLQGIQELPGIPKGITFSPDGNCLLVTFSDLNSLGICDIDRRSHGICPTPRQSIEGLITQISRPEDVKISPDGKYCAITNSDAHTVTFYSYDPTLNVVTQSAPIYILKNPEAELCLPHGIAFSPDGSFFVVTQFGPIGSTSDGSIFWHTAMQANASKFNIYKIRTN